MAKLEILQYPDPRLRRRATPVAPDAISDELRTLIEDMLETMYAAPGIGLAATQVNVTQRVIVIDVSENADSPRALINPEILELGGDIERSQEGCLSVPGVYDEVSRHTWARVRALDPHGQPLEFEAEGLLAVCVQHEIDHLDGKLFVDYLSELKRKRLRKRIEKEQRQEARAQPSAATRHAPI
ncbi:MAG TPA: peptide deformylase [Gammaproteobacteria bacterium]|nr:peptide deformylase [Gammaproteobacteria bacterium]